MLIAKNVEYTWEAFLDRLGDEVYLAYQRRAMLNLDQVFCVIIYHLLSHCALKSGLRMLEHLLKLCEEFRV